MTTEPDVVAVSTGLTSSEAEARRRAGEGNRAVSASSRSYGRILRTNVFNLYNSILFAIGAALLALGRYSDAVISVSIGLLNAVISAVQEIRAKRQLDRLQLLGRSTVVVLRDGTDTEVLPEEVVRGDVVRVRPGNQLVVDGPVLDGAVEVDESLLTGESEAQLRGVGEDLLSGSHAVGGGGLQLARDVGAASYANRLTAEARQSTTDTTPLQRQIAFCVRLVMVVVVLMSGAILLQAALEGFTLVRVVQTAAVLSGLVPYGLFFLIVLAYTAGAVTSSRRGALVQRVNAVESVSNVDVVCTDKTGTLTTGRLTLANVAPLDGHDPAEVSEALGSFARSVGATNLTSTALAAQLTGRPLGVLEEVAFSSSLRWSAVRTDRATWVLGAPEALAPPWSGRTSAPTFAPARWRACASSSSRKAPTRPLRCAELTADRRCPGWSLWPWWRSPTSYARTCPTPWPGSRRRASTSWCSPATTPTRSPRWPPAPVWASPRRSTPLTSTSSPIPSWTQSSRGRPCSDGSPRSRRNVSSPLYAARAGTWPWSATASTTRTP